MKVNGITYKNPCSVVLGVENDSPVFGHLQGLYVLNNISLHVRVANIIMFDEHHHTYVVKSTDINILKQYTFTSCIVSDLCTA